MQIVQHIINFSWWIIENLSVNIGGYTFNFIGAVIFGGILGIALKILHDLFDF